MNIFKDFEKNIHLLTISSSRYIYQKLFKSFTYLLPRNIISNILNEEGLTTKIDEVVSDKDFEKSETEIESFESVDELKRPQEYVPNQPIGIVFR